MATGDTDTVSTRALDQVLEPGAILMVGTGPIVMDARPLTVARVDPQRIDFLVDAREDWVRSLSEGDPVHATLSDNRSNVWASLRGSGTTSADPALIDELWSPPASAYFDDGRDTPGITAFSIRVHEGRWWSSPAGRVGSLLSLVRAAIGDADASGEHGQVDLGAQG
jgi:general stress protein 26